ncbi:MAG: hypothetical protein ABR530_09800 [Pyrinomonadaceae bacterium]
MKRRRDYVSFIGASLLGIAVFAITHAASAQEKTLRTGTNAGIVRQIDHVLFITPGGRGLVTLLTDTFGLPVVFPQPGESWTASTGIGVGNVTLEVFHRPPTPAGETPVAGRISSLALQPTDLETALMELKLRGIGHDETPPRERKPGEPLPRWKTVGLERFGHGLFLIQYVFDMDARRSRFEKILRDRKGGPLGIVRVKEVVIATDQPDQVRPQWIALLGPVVSAKDDLWSVGDGPAIRLVRTGDPHQSTLVVEVMDLSRATKALLRLNVPALSTKHEIRIDPAALLGLRLILQKSGREKRRSK